MRRHVKRYRQQLSLYPRARHSVIPAITVRRLLPITRPASSNYRPGYRNLCCCNGTRIAPLVPVVLLKFIRVIDKVSPRDDNLNGSVVTRMQLRLSARYCCFLIFTRDHRQIRVSLASSSPSSLYLDHKFRNSHSFRSSRSAARLTGPSRVSFRLAMNERGNKFRAELRREEASAGADR